MAEHDSATVMFSKGEARMVIAALADDESTRSGRESERLLNLQDRLAATFDFDEGRGNGDDGVTDTPDPNQAILGEDDLLDGGSDEESIELSREEADEVVDALDDYETSSEDRDIVENVRGRLSETFEL